MRNTNNPARWIAVAFTLALFVAAGMQAVAQTAVAENGVMIKRLPGEQGTYTFIGSEMSFSDKVVTGAPYSAKAVTETIQNLSDGNRIVRRTTAIVARDSEGRTRNEQRLPAIGPYAPESDEALLITINDPVEGVTYVLRPKKQSAQKLAHSVVAIVSEDGEKRIMLAGPGSSAERKAHLKTVIHAKTAGEDSGAGASFSWKMSSVEKEEGDVTTEMLPSRTIEGVLAEGKRITRTIAASAIGNELPIRIVTETWYSPELQITLLKKDEDPRFGETVYRVTEIDRSEPDHSLFEIPSSYSIK